MKIGIIGLGLIGGTIAKCLNENHTISAYDISSDSLAYAIENNIIHKAYNNIKDFLAENSLIYLCLYPNSLIDFFKENQSYFKDNTVFIEISGVKKYIIDAVTKIQNKNIDIVFTHPVAGSEKVGIKYANENIFKNANYIITPVDSNTIKNIKLAEKLATEMGFLNISKISPEKHDDIIAYTSQLTHIISLSLVKSMDTNLHTKYFIGDSYRDLTRISEINGDLWNELFLHNKANLLDKITKFKNSINDFEKAILSDDAVELKKLMLEARKIKEIINKG